MALSVTEVKAILKSPKQKQVIQKAIKQENRIRFHVETYMEPGDIQQPLTVFLEWVKTLIPVDKYNIFVSLFKFPTPIVELSNRIFAELEKVFDGRNPAINFQFTEAELRTDWEDYRKSELKEPEVWRAKGFQSFKTAINSILIIDLPGEQNTDLPEPYFYWLGIEHVIDFGMKDERIDYIIFNQGNNRVAIYDDESYRVAMLDEKNEITLFEIESPHDLGYCPAMFFWTTPLNQKLKQIKKSPISPELSNLDWLLFFGISKRNLDLYASYPIYSAYEADCDFMNSETQEYCDGGFLRNSDDNYMVLNTGTVQPCPVCSDKRIAGAGTFLEIPVPKEGSPDLSNPVVITTIDKESLDYNVSEESRLRERIFASVVGSGGDVQQKAAINEMQVSASFENKSTVLNNLKGNFEKAIKFADDTCCRLRYGVRFLGSSISLGTEFYIFSLADLYAQYKQAKENGAAEFQLDAISDEIMESEYRNNPSQMQRMLVLKQLEPYRHNTRSELVTLSDKNLVDPELMRIKINFNSFVERFEIENINIVEFGSQIEFSKKIQIITDKFKEYGSEQKTGIVA
ncbi:MAG: hypothetical protein HQ522_16375 [Bacteroidetes bacterium]|nr:hypothetical protein [Bacteroidota bacterium]